MTEKVLPKIESIEFDLVGQYILLVTSGMTDETFRELVDTFCAWQESDEKILVLHRAPGIEFRIERVGGDEDDFVTLNELFAEFGDPADAA